jgi:formylglycine-generating enzyme required for sulfatase activity
LFQIGSDIAFSPAAGLPARYHDFHLPGGWKIAIIGRVRARRPQPDFGTRSLPIRLQLLSSGYGRAFAALIALWMMCGIGLVAVAMLVQHAKGAPAPKPVAPKVLAPVGAFSSERAPQPLSRAEERAIKRKDTFKECAACPEMVVVPAGTFTMGAPPREAIREADEGPTHPVTFARAFAVGKFSVTFDEWDVCAAEGGCKRYRPDDQGWGRGRRPVINVSWSDAKGYVAWLSRKTGKRYQLLSESAREYVTRAGTTTPFWWGTTITTRLANFDGNYTYAGSPKGEFRQRTVPVDSFAPNPWGLYQVHGNVWEWTEDCWNENYQGAPANGAAWTTGNCRERVVRGGSWIGEARFLRAANRDKIVAANRSHSIGFRVARTLAQ